MRITARMRISNYWRSASLAVALCLIAVNQLGNPALLESGAVEGVAKDGLTAYLGTKLRRSNGFDKTSPRSAATHSE